MGLLPTLAIRLPTLFKMRRAYFLTAIFVLAAPAALAQERPRFFDNFDTSRGVQVKVTRPDYVPVVIGATKGPKPLMKPPASATKPSQLAANQTQKYLAKTSSTRPSTKARTVAMSAGEGFADREMANYSASKGLGKYVPVASTAGLKGFTTGNVQIDGFIVDSSRRYGIDPLLIYAQMHQESSFKVKALSHKGASGLMQLMPGTARRMGVTNIYDPQQNIEGGVKYMRLLLDMFRGDVTLALAGYNAGEGAVMKYGNSVPPYNETREYVRRIGSRYASISDGSFAQSSRRVSNTTAAKLEKKDSRPLTVYEPNAVAIRLADGRMRLVNQ